MKKIFIPIILLLVTVCSSCSDWLDVKPSDRISEDNNFSNLAGFKKALNGIYVELNSTGLYGRTLSCEFIEILAQRYAVGTDNKANVELMQFNYTGSTARSILTSVWSKAYTLIANANLILKNCEEHRDVLPEEYYHLIKGETLALRAYLHFDLFRLFGPVYSLNPEVLSIPYYKSFSLDVAPTYPASEFVGYVLEDLNNAKMELQDDPIIEYGVKGNSKDVFLQYRNLRLNFYAVQALLARVHWYVGNDEEACQNAEAVIAVQENLFPWINPMKLTNSAMMDRVFSTEILFALQNLERENIYTTYFDGQNLKLASLLAPRADVVDRVFEQDKADYRRRSSLANSLEIAGVNYIIFNKYQGKDSLYNQMIPMLRVSEMYMIAAETSKVDDDKIQYFNTFRNGRGLKGVNRVRDVEYYLEKEWKKEFYGEGQLFFWYKRNNENSMQSASDPWGTVSVKPENYVLPIPDGELKYN